MRAKQAQVDRSVEERVYSAHDAGPAAQTHTPGGSAVLVIVVAGLFVGSALISLALLWLALRAIRWLFSG